MIIRKATAEDLESVNIFESGLYDAGKKVEVLVLDGITTEAADILSVDDMDGPPWYVPTKELYPEIIDQICTLRLGYLADAYVLTGYDGSDEQMQELNRRFQYRWCGYPMQGVVYAR